MLRLPRFLLALALTLAACRPGGPEAPAAANPANPADIEPLPAKSNVLLITVDTLRADHLSGYGYQRATSPVLDRLAGEGVRFDQASVQWPKTTPSFASMMSATYGRDNGVVRRTGIPVPCRLRLLAELLREQGYSTQAVVANAAVGSEFYFDQGFDTFVETWKLEQGAGGADPNRAEAVTNLAVGLLDRIRAEQPRRPYFVWVHYLDPHWPYTPPGDSRDKFQGDERWDPAVRIPIAPGKAKQEMMGIGAGQAEDGRDELAFYVARYDAEIAYTDAQIGRLLEAVRERGLDRDTLTVLTADHGESLGDHHYYFDHGRFAFETCLRVPLIFHYPGVLEPRVDRDPAELIDLAPTLLEAAGMALPGGAWMQGETLTPRLRGVARPPAPQGTEPGGPAADPRLAYAEAGYELDGKWLKTVRDRRFKLIYAEALVDQRWTGGDGVRFVLYDLENDPGETKNVADAFPADLDRLKRALWRWDRAPRFDALVEPESAECQGVRPMAGETEALLKSLGYL